MTAKFAYDPFAVLLGAYAKRSDVAATICWVEGLHEEENACGWTNFDNTPIIIVLDVDCPVRGALDALAHELAHIIAGYEAGHGDEWLLVKDELLASLEADMDEEEDTDA